MIWWDDHISSADTTLNLIDQVLVRYRSQSGHINMPPLPHNCTICCFTGFGAFHNFTESLSNCKITPFMAGCFTASGTGTSWRVFWSLLWFSAALSLGFAGSTSSPMLDTEDCDSVSSLDVCVSWYHPNEENSAVNEGIVLEWLVSRNLIWLQSCEKAQCEILLFCAKTVVNELHNFEVACACFLLSLHLVTSFWLCYLTLCVHTIPTYGVYRLCVNNQHQWI